MAKNFKEAMDIVNDKIAEHAEASGYPSIHKTRENGQESSGEGSAPRGASAQITQRNKIAARANSSAKTPASSQATFNHTYRTPGSEAKPLSQIKPKPPSRPGLVPLLAPKMPARK